MGDITAGQLVNSTIYNPDTFDVGDVKWSARASAPAGWLACDGSAVSRTTFDALFLAIGTTYGVGDGSTTFNLPDVRGRVAVAEGTHADVSALGANDGQAVANRRPKHRTTQSLGASVSDSGHFHSTPLFTAGSGVGSQNLAEGDTLAGALTDGSAATDTKTTGIGVSITGSIGTNNANDALDTPSYIVLSCFIKHQSAQ